MLDPQRSATLERRLAQAAAVDVAQQGRLLDVPAGLLGHPKTYDGPMSILEERQQMQRVTDELVEVARALRPRLVAEQAQTEERTYYSEEVHQALLEAGFYRMYVPRRYGGLEVDVPTFMRVGVELALRAGGRQHARCPGGEGHARVRPARRPDLLGTRAGYLHPVAGVHAGRRRVQRAGRVRQLGAGEGDASAAIRAALSESGLSALVRRSVREDSDGRRGDDAMRRAAHGVLPSERQR
jgi:alkylation response protein AidB-like acyl-CoA dehydrogenase